VGSRGLNPRATVDNPHVHVISVPGGSCSQIDELLQLFNLNNVAQ